MIHTQTGADPEKGMVAIEETKEEEVEGNYFVVNCMFLCTKRK